MNHGRGFNFLQAVEQNIAQSGRMVQFVFDPNGVEPSFAYTIGNFLAGLPEVAMSGLRPEMMGYFLNLTSEMMRAGALTMKDGLVTGELAEGLDTTFRKVTEQTHDAYFGKLVEYSEYRQQPVPEVYQLVIPDRQNRFPWNEGCDQKVIDVQYAWYRSLH
jgi:hypothetical protein